MTPIVQNKDVYKVLFCIDEYKKAFVICKWRNGYVQKNDAIPHVTKKEFNRKSRLMEKLLKQIIKGNCTTLEEYVSLTQACAVLQGDLLIFMNRCNKIKAVKKDKVFKKIYDKNQFMFTVLSGKSMWDILFDNHFIGITCGSFVVALCLPVIGLSMGIRDPLSIIILILMAILFCFTVSFYGKKLSRIVIGSESRQGSKQVHLSQFDNIKRYECVHQGGRKADKTMITPLCCSNHHTYCPQL